ncbi:MAG: DUF2344 domain-containing protein [Elusimicrobiaceae bacterium]|nr:DUF2344 domain-containing protein [Elusimicrobiaceae bacterium]MBT4007815.1 DUF2344 domain-containing protein [Elusimicrobiaceae bacterium]
MDNKVYKFRIRYEKKGDLTKLSHLETISLFRKVILEEGWQFYSAKRAENQPRMSFGNALSAEYESECEYVDIFLIQKVLEKELFSSFKKHNIIVLDVKKIPFNFPSIESLTSVVEYEVSGKFETDEKSLNKFLNKKEIQIKREKEDKTIEFDAKEQIISMVLKGNKILIRLKLVATVNVKVEELFFSWLGENKELKIVKKNIFWQNSNGELRIL